MMQDEFEAKVAKLTGKENGPRVNDNDWATINTGVALEVL